MHVICPRCGREGVLYIREIKGKKYVIVKHRETEHGLGPITDKEKIIEQLVQAYVEKLREIIK